MRYIGNPGTENKAKTGIQESRGKIFFMVVKELNGIHRYMYFLKCTKLPNPLGYTIIMSTLPD